MYSDLLYLMEKSQLLLFDWGGGGGGAHGVFFSFFLTAVKSMPVLMTHPNKWSPN